MGQDTLSLLKNVKCFLNYFTNDYVIMLLLYYNIVVAIAITAFSLVSPVMLTGKSLTSSTASQVYFPESPGAGERSVRRRISLSSVMVTLALSWISSPSSSQRTTAPGRDTWTSRTSGSPETPSSLSPEPPLGEASFTGGSEVARRRRLHLDSHSGHLAP